jgi:hypothetical protein
MTTFIDVDELNSLSQLRENSEQNTVTDSENVTPSLGRNADRVSFLLNFNLLLLISRHRLGTFCSFNVYRVLCYRSQITSYSLGGIYGPHDAITPTANPNRLARTQISRSARYSCILSRSTRTDNARWANS